ncbi:FxSxx-COOH system tetratricopeptide repeat protein [Microbispora hainanensis]|uniref:FxSxx-COOH system tetratricopeptide repeat protein n=1 Tax=Microbispora hainanensis TaxID=568844 RepID=UPI0033FB1AEC
MATAFKSAMPETSISAAADPETSTVADSGNPPSGQILRGTQVGGNVYQIGSARDVSIGAQLPARPPLPAAVDTEAPPGLIGMPRPAAAVFVGRDEALTRVEQALAEGAGVISQASVYGLGGIGKSELALQYANRHRDRYRLVWWVESDTSTQIQTGLADLARAIASGAHSVAAAQATVEEAAAWALTWLATHRHWLLVFDNVEQVADIEPYLGRLRGGHVLITTRRDIGWQGAPINLDVLTSDAAARLLAALIGPSRAPLGSEPHELSALADELGCLPLALTQAGAYIGQTPGMTARRYRGLLAKSPGRLFGTVAAGRDADRVVARVWTLTRSRIGELNSLAPRLLALLACYAPDQLPVEVLNGLPEVDELDVEEALGLLASYSMISRSADGQHVSVHRLVQAVTWADLADDDRAAVRATAAGLLEAALPADPETTSSWSAYARLLPHARALLAPDTPGMAAVIAYMQASGDYRTARDLQQRRFTALRDSIGPEQSETLAAEANLASYTGQAGDAASARDMLATLLPVCERVSGPEHPVTLSVRALLARFSGEAGDATAARDQCAVLLPLYERAAGPEHPDTLRVRSELARWTGQVGDPAAARDLFTALLPVRERVLGPEHPDTLNVLANIAYWSGEAGDAATARDLCAALLPALERVSGPEHPETLGGRAELARWTGDAGDAAAARDMLAALLPVRERVSGPEHPRTLIARFELARWTGKAGDPAAARDMLVEVLQARERVLGLQHSSTLYTRVELAHWTAEAGDAATVRDTLAELLAKYQI